MNTKTLAKQYGALTPRERLPLLLAADARGDEEEKSRLALSAPRVCHRVQDYFGLGYAFLEISWVQFMEVMNLAATYLETVQLAGTITGESAQRAWDAVCVIGYAFQAQLDGWRLFCAEDHLDPEVFWSALPGLDRIKRAEQEVFEQAAFLAEGVRRWCERSGRDGAVPTVEHIAAGLRASLNARAAWWG
jgi:hypothetical protein